MNQKGLAQNEAEVDIFTDRATKQIVTRVHDFDRDYAWIVSDIVKPLNRGWYEFEALTGVDFNELMEAIHVARNGAKAFSLWDDDSGAVVTKKIDGKLKEYVDAVIALINNNGLLTGDIGKIEHWGGDTRWQSCHARLWLYAACG